MELSRVIDKENISLLSLLAKSIWAECYSEILSDGQIEYMTDKYLSPKAVSQQIENDNYEYYFIKDEKDIVGFTAFSVKDNALFLSKLYVKKEYRRKGYAGFVMEYLEKRCKEAKLPYIWLTVNVNNHNAINSYKKRGFYTFKDECTDIGNGYFMDDHFMKKEIGY
ncbi:MAG: GNAT family N-acetyltransferase [Ruminococcaceae bacterium]|nr:GNAT family N-acetyltransferase [Oscillospiraceae bacterium]